MKSFSKFIQESVELEEKLKVSDDMGTWVKDFQDSDAAQFKGKSQKKRQQMAIAAKLAAERNEEVELDEISDRTKTSYLAKAKADKKSAQKRYTKAAYRNSGASFFDADTPEMEQDAKRIAKRRKGIAMAREEVELDEVSDKKLDAYRQKAFADQPAGDDGSDKYRKRKFGRDLAFAKQTGRAKVLATKEEVKLDEVSTEKLRDYASAALQDKNKAKADKRWKYAGKAMDKVADREVKAAHDRKYNKMEEVEQIDELSKKTLSSYVKKASADQYFKGQDAQYHDNKAKKAEGPFAKETKKKHYGLAARANDKASNRDTGIGRAVDRLTKEEVELDEAAPKMKGDWLKKERERNREHDAAMGRTPTGRKKPVRQMTSTQRSLAKMRGEEVEQIDEISASTLRSYVDKSRADKSRQQKARTVAKNDHKKYGIPSDKKRADAAHMKASQRNTGISMAKRKLGGYTKGTEPKVLAREEVELEEQYDLVESYLTENSIDVDTLSVEQLDEIIGKAIGGAFKLGANAVTGAAKRMSTSGRADAAEKKANAAEKKNKDRERIRKAQDRLRAARQAATS